MMSAFASFSLALAAAGQFLDCSYAVRAHQAAAEIVVTTALEETAGTFEALLSPRLDALALASGQGGAAESFGCVAADKVVVCTAARDRKAFVLFLEDGRFSLSAQGKGAVWTATSGRCTRRDAAAAI